MVWSRGVGARVADVAAGGRRLASSLHAVGRGLSGSFAAADAWRAIASRACSRFRYPRLIDVSASSSRGRLLSSIVVPCSTVPSARLGPLQLADDVVPKPVRLARAAQCARLVRVSLDGVGRGLERVADRSGELTPAHGIDLTGGATERRVDPGREVVDVRL